MSEFVCSKCGKDVERPGDSIFEPWIHQPDGDRMCFKAIPTLPKIRNKVIERKHKAAVEHTK